MRLGRAPVYAIFAVVHLTERQAESPVPGREIAEACGIPSAHLMKILQQLVRSGILTSGRGPSGGFGLGKAPEEISVLEIVEAVEGPMPTEFEIEDSLTVHTAAREGVESCCTEVAHFARNILANTRITTLMH